MQKSRNAFSMQQIARVLDKANKAGIKLLKGHWQEVIDRAKNDNKRSLINLLQNSEPVAAGKDHILAKFEEEIHCEIVNKDGEKRSSIESVVYNVANKNIRVAGVPSDQWQGVRTEYLQNRRNEDDDMPKQQARQTDIAQKAKDLSGEETIHVIDEE